MSATVEGTSKDGVDIIRIRRPERRNALDDVTWWGLQAEVEASANRMPRVLIITGSEGHFSAGMDLRPDNPVIAELTASIMARDPAPARAFIRRAKALMDLIAGFPAPTIAAVDGSCIGGGMELALACDLRVASEDARFSINEVRAGMVPDLGGTARLTRLIGTGRAASLILTGRVITGMEAFHLGLVEYLAPMGALDKAMEVARDIQAGAPKAVGLALQVIRQVPDLDQDEAMAVETEAGVSALLSGEVVEGITAFMSHRAPRW